MFKVTTSFHGMLCIEVQRVTVEQCQFLRSAVLDNRTDSMFYLKRQTARPFLQGDDDGWILIEFWSRDEQAVNEYVAWLNSVYDETIQHWKTLGIFD